MSFNNPVVGGEGGELVRDSIKSPNYVPNVSGWIIKRDGTAEFNNILIRGSLVVTGDAQSANFVAGVSGWRLRSTGEAEFNGNATVNNGTITGGVIQTATAGKRIKMSILSGDPTIEFYDGTHPLSAKVTAYGLGTNGGLVMTAGDTAVESTATIVSDTLAALNYDHQVGNLETANIQVGPPTNALILLRTTSVAGQDLEFGFDYTRSTPDLIPGRMFTNGEICIQGNGVNLGSNFPSRVIDGKAPGVTTVTVINVADTTIGVSNSTSVYFEDGWAYRVTVQCDVFYPNAGPPAAGTNRIDWKLWDGGVGTGVQLGGTCRLFMPSAVQTSRHTMTMTFLFKYIGTGISANVNLSASRAVGATAISAEHNGSFMMIIEKIGDANRISNL